MTLFCAFDFSSANYIVLDVHLEFSVSLFDFLVENAFKPNSEGLKLSQLLLLHFFDSKMLSLLEFLDPFDLFVCLHLFESVFDVFCLFVVPDFDQIRQIFSLLENVRRILDSWRLFCINLFNKIFHLFFLYSDQLFLVLFELLNHRLDFLVPLSLKLFDLLFAFFADDLNLDIAMTTCSFSRMAIVYLRWMISCPFSCSILFLTLSAPLKSYR